MSDSNCRADEDVAQAAVEKRRAYGKAWRARNPEKASAYGKAWRENNPEKARAREAARRERDREKIRAYQKAHYERNAERIQAQRRARPRDPEQQRAYDKAWRERHPERAVARGKAWNERNPEKQRAQRIAQERISRPEACQRCGKQGLIHRHHPDYSKPLLVECLCPACHKLAHKEMREYLEAVAWFERRAWRDTDRLEG
jgi:hypothetical protein